MTTMTKQQKLDTLEAVEAGAFAKLENADPAAVEFNNILNNIGMVRHITEMVKFGDPELFTAPEEAKCAPVHPDPKPIKPEPDAEIPPQPDPEPEETDCHVADAPRNDRDATPTLTLEEVRNKLITYARAGVDLAALLQQLGCAKLSDVPADKYADLLESAERASEGAN